jgi:uncharacterized protein
MKTDINYLIIPGYGNSGPDHWQTYFENKLPNSFRVNQASWEEPLCDDWVKNIDDAVSKYDSETIVFVCHSLGCIALAHWASRFKAKVKGAFLVAVPDIENPYISLPLESFTPIPIDKLPFPSVMFGSSNDHWATLQRTQFFAEQWGSKLIIKENAGHINTDSGFGAWDEGLTFLGDFTKSLK